MENIQRYDVSVLGCTLLYLVTCSTSVFLYIASFVSCSILVSLVHNASVAHHKSHSIMQSSGRPSPALQARKLLEWLYKQIDPVGREEM